MTQRKGIILAGGSGTRLHPITYAVCKQLLPVYDKPMIYYPLTTLMLAGIREMLLITSPRDRGLFEHLLGDGSQWGLSFKYEVQAEPHGIAEALLIGEKFLEERSSALILGDNIFYGDGLGPLIQRAAQRNEGASIFAYWVRDPERYGIVEFDERFTPLRLVEKPAKPMSNYAVTGLYLYDGMAPEHARQLRRSARGELEITDLNQRYLDAGHLFVERFGRGYAWLDAGTHDSLLESAQFIQIVENRQGLKIACPEEIAYRLGYIDADQLAKLAASLGKTGYGAYLRRVLEPT